MYKKFLLTVFLSCFLSVSMQAEFRIAQAGGWYESAFVEWTPYEYATGYTVVVKNLATEKSSTLDNQLIRSYGTYFRADALGLEPGNYQMGVFAEVSCEPESACAIAPIYTETLSVKAHDRSGFAHFGYPQGVGAYKKDGTEITTIVSVEMVWSIQVFFFSAATIPSRMPKGMLSKME